MRFGIVNAKRFRQWREVLEEEGKELGLREKLLLLGTLLYHALRLPFRRQDRRVFWTKMRHCHKCPVFDKTLHRCRPWTGSDSGCGCFSPWLALSTDVCWIDLRNGGGWLHALKRRGLR